MAFFKQRNNEKDDFTTDIWETDAGPYGVSGFNIEGSEVGNFCHVCKIDLESKPKINDHIKGKKHQNKIKFIALPVKQFVVESSTGMENDPDNLFLPNYCKVCEAELSTTEQQEGHYMSEKHQKRVRFHFLCQVGVKELPQPKAAKPVDEGGKEGLSYDEYCSLCKCEFTSYVVAESHYVGKKHAKKLREQAEKKTVKHKANIDKSGGEKEFVFTEWTVAPDMLIPASKPK